MSSSTLIIHIYHKTDNWSLSDENGGRISLEEIDMLYSVEFHFFFLMHIYFFTICQFPENIEIVSKCQISNFFNPLEDQLKDLKQFLLFSFLSHTWADGKFICGTVHKLKIKIISNEHKLQNFVRKEFSKWNWPQCMTD